MKSQGPSQDQIKSIITLYSNGQISDAIIEIKALNKQYPNVPLLFNIMGACYKTLKQFDEAIKMFENATKIKPDYAEAYFNLGVILQELQHFNKSIDAYQKAIKILPKYPDAHNNLGIVFLDIGELDNSITHFEWAVAYKDDFAEAHNNLGSALQQKGQLQNALNSYKKSITLKPDFSQAHNNLGILLQKLGDIEGAFLSYEKAITFEPSYVLAHFNLSAIKKYTVNDPQITLMQSILSLGTTSHSNKVHLCFALAKVNEDLGNQDELFKFLDEGNRLRKEELNFSLDEPENQNIIIKNLFNASPSILSKVSYEPSIIKPVFIVGMPRSGTSLVEQIISSHKEVYGAGELKVLSKIIIQLIQDSLTFDKIELSENTIFSVRQKYLDYLSSLNTSENVITDKWPLNFRNIGFNLSAFPEAKIDHLKRDSRALCWSIYKHYFSERGNGWAYNQSDIAQFYLLYEDLMSYWHELYPNKIYDICYEDLTTNQEEETRKLLDYCGLDWDKNCLDFHKNTRAVNTASSMQVRQKMYTGSSQAWKEHEAYLQTLIKGLN
jgi:tetratricopeptide (TPR) repeat protein